MSKMSIPFKGTLIVTLVALALGTVALTSAFARGVHAKSSKTSPTTAAASAPANTQMMESSWKSELSRLGFDNFVLRRIDNVLDAISRRLDKDAISQRPDRDDRLSGKLESMFNEVNLLLAKAQSVATAHAGFDATGKVTDQTQALKSIQMLGADLNELRGTFIHRLEQLIR